ncbi:MAG: bifunctional glutamate N-acetyltransferase/amino-acid acetyltransferase ArgJ [Candidatus Omnitrophica bacterium]|nr:bifunctional glutamate N-acetyltransferase/amino-acid acetyltransferase ArgJ [Candidatus Omnitrophota bacterium]MDD5771441.1 bifunctional glutamate N-acetyltransferase/amino-acid acetyltransferase ArgJ [Candidatus Omnitrophota bacterium]
MKISLKAIPPSGFSGNGIACGLKRSGDADLALLYSDAPAIARAKFTTGSIIAAPLTVSKKHLKLSKTFRALLVNSGNANCFTGKAGIRDAEESARCLGWQLSIPASSVLVNSTGIIGKRLDIAKIKKGIPGLVSGLSGSGIHKAAKAMMTTDTFAKEISVSLKIGGKTVNLCAVAKGAGMIAPNMATMLCFILTDANICGQALEKALAEAVEISFNCISVDGCMSTNDTVLVLANGRAGNKIIASGKALGDFSKALKLVCLELSKMIVMDAEGATKFIRIDVCRAKNFCEARRAALNIANSALFKTAVFGENPNFGRVVAAVGASGLGVREDQLKIHLGSLKGRQVRLKVSLSGGDACATVYTSDLTPGYIKINAEYN